MNIPSTIADYLRRCSQELGERILNVYPALQAPGDPVSDRFNSLLRSPFAAQRWATMGIVKRWEMAKAAAVIAECGYWQDSHGPFGSTRAFWRAALHSVGHCHCDHKLAVWPTYASTTGPVAFTGVYRLGPGSVPDTGGGKNPFG